MRTDSTEEKASSSDVNLHQWDVEDESSEKRKQSTHSDINVGSTDAQPNLVMHDTKESREITKGKKPKKKAPKKKAKKEKKKSTSVIDDIFGF